MNPFAAKILIAGAGAIGSIFGCLLRIAGHEVTLLGRDWHLEAVRSRGLFMDGLWGQRRAGGFRLASTLDQLSGPYDLILMSVKSYDTGSMVEGTAPYLGSDGLAVALQNGLGNVEALREKLGAERSLGASILVGAKISEPGRVTVTVQAAPIVIGPLEPTPAALEKCRFWSGRFNEAGIPTEATEKIQSHLWAKVFYNAPLNPLGALLRVHYGPLGELPELKAIMDRIVDEAFRVAQMKKVDLLWETAAAYREHFYGTLLPATYDHQSSMLQDLERGRPTEIDALNGRIWRYGEELGLSTPFNEIMTRLVRGSERRRRWREPSLRKGLGRVP